MPLSTTTLCAAHIAKAAKPSKTALAAINKKKAIQTKQLNGAFAASIEGLGKDFDGPSVLTALEAGNDAKATKVIMEAWDTEVAFSQIKNTVKIGGGIAEKSILAQAESTLVFSPTVPWQADAALSKYAASRIREVTKKTMTAVKQIVSRSLKQGFAGRHRSMVEDIRQRVGLTQTQDRWVENWKNKLVTSGVSPAEADILADKYSKNFRKFRAKLIAENEAGEAMEKGQYDAWNWAVDNKHIPKDQLGLTWLTSQDIRVSPKICRPINRQVIRMGGKFKTGDGRLIERPLAHVRCRCDVAYEVMEDKVKVKYPKKPHDPTGGKTATYGTLKPKVPKKAVVSPKKKPTVPPKTEKVVAPPKPKKKKVTVSPKKKPKPKKALPPKKKITPEEELDMVQLGEMPRSLAGPPHAGREFKTDPDWPVADNTDFMPKKTFRTHEEASKAILDDKFIANSLEQYTGDAYEPMTEFNRLATVGKTDLIKDYGLTKTERILERVPRNAAYKSNIRLNNALKKIPPRKEGITVWRGTKISKADMNAMKKGTYLSAQKMSFSQDAEVAMDFVGERKGNRLPVLLRLNSRTGLDIQSVSLISREKEVLVRKSTKMRLVSKTEKKKKVRVLGGYKNIRYTEIVLEEIP